MASTRGGFHLAALCLNSFWSSALRNERKLIQKDFPMPASETNVLRREVGKSKLAVTAKIERRRRSDPEDNQFAASTGVLNPNGILNWGVCMKWSARRDVPDTGRINAHATS
jgi:hypothetical protein